MIAQICKRHKQNQEKEAKVQDQESGPVRLLGGQEAAQYANAFGVAGGDRDLVIEFRQNVPDFSSKEAPSKSFFVARISMSWESARVFCDALATVLKEKALPPSGKGGEQRG